MTQRPPTIDPVAAERWLRMPAPSASPWLHEEIGRRMDERLQWITRQPAQWADWFPARGGMEAHRLVAARYPHAGTTVIEATPDAARATAQALAKPWWRPGRWMGATPVVLVPPAQAAAESMDMVWANMALHFAADPQALIAEWHRALAPEGYLMFSCLGPDTLSELRAVYAQEGWSPPGAAFTDMHDWGDMLVQAGFAEPVMDMERIVVTYGDVRRLMAELRQAGRNMHPSRFAALRGRGHADRLAAALSRPGLRDAEGRIALTVEVVYGHAFKPQPRVRLAPESAVSLQAMRGMLRRPRGPARPG